MFSSYTMFYCFIGCLISVSVCYLPVIGGAVEQEQVPSETINASSSEGGLMSLNLKYPNAVVYADTDELNEKIQEKTHFVMFYMPWSAQCRVLLPIFDELAKKYNEDPFRQKIVLAKVDCYDPDLADACSQHKVYGHPTLILFQKLTGNTLKCEAQSSDEIDAFIQKFGLTSSSSISAVDEHEPIAIPRPRNSLYELTEATFDAHIAAGHHFVEFYSPNCGHCQQFSSVWEEVAHSFEHHETLKISKIDCMEFWTTCQRYNIKGFPTLMFFSQGRGVQQYKGQRDHKMLKTFATNMVEFLDNFEEQQKHDTDLKEGRSGIELIVAPVLSLTAENFTQSTAAGTDFVLFYDPDCDFCKSFMSVWENLAIHYMNVETISIERIDCVKNFDTCASQNVFSYPTLVFYKNGHRLETYEGPKDLSSIFEFIELMKDKSDDVIHSETSVVVKLDPHNFDEFSRKKYLFVEFYKGWCEYCKSLEPIWDQLAVKYERNKKVTIAKVDCVLYEATLCTRHQVAGYPSMYMFEEGRQLNLYTGPHDLESLYEYVHSYVGEEEPTPMQHMEL